MAGLSDVDDAIEDHSTRAPRALAREATNEPAGDPIAQLVDELLEQWRVQLTELRLDS